MQLNNVQGNRERLLSRSRFSRQTERTTAVRCKRPVLMSIRKLGEDMK